MNRYCCVLFAFSVLTSQASILVPQDLSNSDYAKYKQEMLEAWNRYEEMSIHISGTIDMSMDFENKNPKPGYDLSVFFKRNQHCMLTEDVSDSRFDELYVAMVNKHYGCALTSYDGKQNWSISQVLRQGFEQQNDRVRILPNYWKFYSPVAFHDEYLSEIFSRNGFRIDNISEGENSKGEKTLTVDFRVNYEKNSEEYKLPRIHKGTIILLPEDQFIVESAELITFQNGEPIEQRKYQFTTTASEGNIRVLEKLELRGESLRPDASKGDTYHLLVVCDLKFNKGLPKDSEFTLTAYGLPEPDFVPKSNRILFWLGIIGGMTLICTMSVWYFLKRNR